MTYSKLMELACQSESVENSIEYVTGHIRQFLRRGERVLICFTREETSICGIFEEAVKRCEGIPMVLGEDRRWMTILKTAFTYKCNALIGPPLLILGLGKVARHMGTPLYTRNVVLAGYPAMDWMIEGIQRELDCQVWGCFDPGVGAVVAGFSCDKSLGVHLREDVYGVDIVDDAGNPVADGTVGRMILYPTARPELRFDTADRGKMDRRPCPCGCNASRIMAIDADMAEQTKLSKLGEELQQWTSILDCKLSECGYGMELEMIVFPGEKLPRLPSFSKRIIRAWNPETDEPFAHTFVMKNRLFSEENH